MQKDVSVSDAGPQSIMGRLKRETAGEHAGVDALMDLPGMTRERYVASLKGLRDAHRIVERELARHASTLREFGYDPAQRSKLAWFAEDLSALQPGSRGERDATILFSLENPAAAFGAVYVMEGSTLGGQIIARHVGPTLGVSPDAGLRYFSGYGAATGERWRETSAAISKFASARGDDEMDTMVEGARRTFALVETALRQRLA